MLATVEDGRVVDLRGDPDDVFSRGHICPKGPAMREVQEDPNRLRHPMRRTAGGWQRVGWDEALDEAARKLKEIQRRDGKDAAAIYLGNPTVHGHGAALFLQPLLAALGSKNRFDANSMDANPKLFACLQMYGSLTAVAVPDVDRTDFLLMLGANPAASNGSLMTLGDVRGRLRGIRERGGRIVVLDPRRTETAAWADEHHFIRPGGDAPFLLGLLHVLFAEGFVVDERVARIADGLPSVRSLAERFPPERVAAASGVPAETIRKLARAFGSARTAVCYGRVGTCLNDFGCEASWLIEVVNVVTGNFDRPGGAMFASPAVDVSRLGRWLGLDGWNRRRSRVRGLPEIGGQLPTATLAEEIETPGAGQIRALVTVAGNPVLSAPNGERLARAFAGLEYMVAVDFFINETTRQAHLILPPRYALERPHADVVFPFLAVRNVMKYSEPVVEPAPDTRDEWEILDGLSRRLAGLPRWPRVTPERVLDLALRLGPYRLSVDELRRNPHGIDLGPLRPSRRQRVARPGGRVDLAPAALMEQMARVERTVDSARAADGLVLIGRRQLRSNNSWMQNCHSLVKGPDQTRLLMHPGDAARLGLVDGQEVRVTSRVGEVTSRLEATDAMMPGVVSLPHGWSKVNVNALTDDLRVEPVLGTAVLNGTPVTVSAR